jgi:membrane-anchored protein YejM (alkaline phosphatase superfamily)
VNRLSNGGSFRVLCSAYAANFVLSLFLACGYYAGLASDGPWDIAFRGIALVSNFALIYLPLFGLCALPFRWIGAPAAAHILNAAALFLLQTLIYTDTVIYGLFRFHFNGLVWNLIITPGSADSLKLGALTAVMALLKIVGFAALQAVLFVFLRRLERRGRLEPVLTRPRLALAGGLLILAIAADKGVYAVGDLYDLRGVTRMTKILPLYQPLVIGRSLERRFGFTVARGESLIDELPADSVMHYPLEAPAFPENGPRWNILLIVIESWRFDMLNAETTPFLDRFRAESVYFSRHYSGGNSSRFGVFSLLSGLYGNTWQAALGERRSAILIDALKGLGYRMRILSSTSLAWPEFRKTCFVRVPDAIDDRMPGDTADVRDAHLGPRFLQWAQGLQAREPYFGFFFYDSPHGPYSYPPEFERFTPALKRIDYTSRDTPDMAAMRNSFRNSIHYVDHLLAELLEECRRRGLLDSTIVLVTGDHGQEFGEAGFRGHNSAFDDYQTRVPLLVHAPFLKPATVDRLTSHVDVVPTLLDWLGCRTPPGMYSHGRDLLSPQEHSYVVSAGWDDFALITPRHTVILSMETHNAGRTEVRDPSYRELVDSRTALSEEAPALIDFSREYRKFFR